MKLISKTCHRGLSVAVSVVLAGAVGSASADGVSTLIGGDVESGDQATVALDISVPNAFSYLRGVSGAASATAYLDSHVFCAETPRTATQVSLRPRYQLPATLGNDVWQFPDVYAQSLVYQGSGASSTGAPRLVIGQAARPTGKQFRCLSAQPAGSLDFPNVSQGLFDSGFGGTTTPDQPTGAHQNVTVNAQTFTGFSGLAVSVVKLDTQFDLTQPATTVWTLVDGFNTSALSALSDANWCGLPATWVEGTTPPPQLCDDSVLALDGVVKETGQFVRHQYSATIGSPPHYVLVYRSVVGSATSGTPKQGFAALRTGGGIVGVAEELQDWFADDSVWYNY